MSTERPAAEAVHRARRRQLAQAVLKFALPADVNAATTPAGQVTAPNGVRGPGSVSTVKSTNVNPFSIMDFSGQGLTIAVCPAVCSAASIGPLAYAESASTGPWSNA